MYIIKNAFRCIGRAKGRNILLGVIALVLAVACCIGLSIRQAAAKARTATIGNMTVTATISFDRQSMMGNMERPEEGGSFDRNSFREKIGESNDLTLEEYKTYASAEAVQEFYYTVSANFNGDDAFLPVSTEEEAATEGTLEGSLETEQSQDMGGFGGRGGFGGMDWDSGDFTVIGYSSDTAMTDFANGTASITSGSVFEEGTEDYSCIISEELAAYNDLAVGDTVTLVNPDAEAETYSLTVVGIYASESANDFSMSRFGASQDPANRIYMSADALQRILDASAAAEDTAVTGTVSATYVFASPDDYYAFEEQVRALGLDESYTVSSTDVTAFENSLTPLDTLSTMAGWFLVVILAIGGVILVVMNIFSVRERKYEIGVLTAMGMKKHKVALQFLSEILVVTMIAIMLGTGIGAVCAVPVSQQLLANQVESQETQQSQIEQNFGRPDNFGGGRGGMDGMGGGSPGGDFGGRMPQMDFSSVDKAMDSAKRYVTEIDAAVDLTVVLQMMGIGLGLTLLGGAASVLFVMRYDPLKILANRD